MAPKARTLPTAEEIGNLVPIGRIAKDTPYTADFLRQLARSGKIRAFKLHRDWMTTPDAIRDYLKTQTKRHEKALSLLQSAHKAFLALCVLALVSSATPQAHAFSFFGNPNDGMTTVTYKAPVIDPSAIASPAPSATPEPISNSDSNIATTEDVPANSIQPPPPKTKSVTQNGHASRSVFSNALAQTFNDVLNLPGDIAANIRYVHTVLAPPLDYTASIFADSYRLGRAQLNQVSAQLATNIEDGKTAATSALTDLAAAFLPDVPDYAQVNITHHHTLATSITHHVNTSRVLGIRTSNPSGAASVTQLTAKNNGSVLGLATISGPPGPQGPAGAQGPPGPTGALTPGYSGPSGIVQNDNGKTTAVIGGTPIVSYIPATLNQSFNGASLAGFTQLSANSLTAAAETVTGNLTVQGNSSFSGGTFTGPLNAATSTISALTVSGNATFSGSTTIAGLTVTSLNPGLTSGSVAFQGASGLSQDNANFFYDSTNHRLGLGTTTPGQLLTVAGNSLVTGNATTSGNQIISGTLTTAGASTLATTTITNLTMGQALGYGSGGTGTTTYTTNGVLYAGASALQSTAAGTSFQVLRSNGNSAPSYSDIGSLLTAASNITLSGTSTIAVAGSPSFTGTTSVATLTTTGNVGIGQSNPGYKLDVSGTLHVSGASTFDSNITAPGITSSSANFQITRANSGASVEILGGNGGDFKMDTNGNALFSGGNVGINTTTPGSTFVVAGTSLHTGQAIFNANVGIGTTGPADILHIRGSAANVRIEDSGSSAAGLTLYNGATKRASFVDQNTGVYIGTNVAANLLLGRNGTASVAVADGGATGVMGVGTTTLQSQTALTVQGQNTASSWWAMRVQDGSANNLFAITNAGNVGIGTTTPTALLSLPLGTTAANGINFGDASANLYRAFASGIKTDGQLVANGGYGAPALSNGYNFTNWLIYQTSSNGSLFIRDSNNSLQAITITAGASHAGSVALDGNLQVNGTGNNYFNGGNVGIGTTSPSTGVLQVEKNSTSYTAMVAGYDVNATGHPYYTVGKSSVSGQNLNFGFLNELSIGAFWIGGDDPAAGQGIVLKSGGNVGLGTTTPGHLITLSGGAFSDGATWSNASDRNIKDNFATVTPSDVLQKIDGLVIQQWNYKTDSASNTHIGPTAQDFYAAFHTGGDSGQTSISTIDPAGVALLGIQALDQKITALQGAMNGNATTTGGLSVYAPTNFSGDSVGQAKIIQGATSVRVSFSQPYSYQPIITADVLDAFVEHYISDVDASGFTIRTTLPVTSNTTFDWHSFASSAAQLSVSGMTQSIPLILPPPQSPTPPPIDESTPTTAASPTPPVVTPQSPSPDPNGSSTPPPETSSPTSTPPQLPPPTP